MRSFVIAFCRRRPLASVLIICALAWLPGLFTLPPLDRDESRFAQATKQMLESRDFIDIKLGQDARYAKPVGIYWLQAASTSVLGNGGRSQIWTYRVPSFLGALAAVAATFWMVRAFAAADTAFFAALILGLSVLLMSEAKIAKTDAVLLATVTITQAVLLRVYAGYGGKGAYTELASLAPPSSRAVGAIHFPRKRGQKTQLAPLVNGGRKDGLAFPIVLAGWGAVGLGVLIKGPLIAIVCAVTIAALVIADRDWRWLKQLRPGAGIALALAIILPWAIAIGLASHGAFYEKSLGQDFALKLVGEQETHGAPPGYYTLLASLTFWPGTLLLLPALIIAWRRRTDPPIRFLLAWAVATWVLFELVPTKLPHYVLPAYPALAAICAVGMKSWAVDGKPVLNIARWVSLILFVVAGIAFALFVAIAPVQFGSGGTWWLYVAFFPAAAAVVSVIPAVLACRPEAAFARAGIAAILVYAIAGFVTVPRLNALWLSPRMADAVAQYAQPSDPAIITAGYSEPSIQFLLGTRTLLENGAGAARASAQSGGLVLVSDDQREAFLSGIAAAGTRAQPLDQIDGLNYSRGRKTRITLYRVLPRPS